MTAYEAFLKALEGSFEDFVKSDAVNEYLQTIGPAIKSNVIQDGVVHEFLVVTGYEKERGQWGTIYNNQIRFGKEKYSLDSTISSNLIISPNFFSGKNVIGEEIEYRMGLIKGLGAVYVLPVIFRKVGGQFQAKVLGDLCVIHSGVVIDKESATKLGLFEVKELTAYQQFISCFWNIDDYIRKQNPKFESDFDITVWEAVEVFSGRIVDQMLAEIKAQFHNTPEWMIPVVERKYWQDIVSQIENYLGNVEIFNQNQILNLLKNLCSYMLRFNNYKPLEELKTKGHDIFPFLKMNLRNQEEEAGVEAIEIIRKLGNKVNLLEILEDLMLNDLEFVSTWEYLKYLLQTYMEALSRDIAKYKRFETFVKNIIKNYKKVEAEGTLSYRLRELFLGLFRFFETNEQFYQIIKGTTIETLLFGLPFVTVNGKQHEIKNDQLYLDYLNIKQIKEIEGLETLVKLKVLSLRANKISEITGLNNLRSLEKLDLGENQITEIKGLEGLKNLRELDLASNQITEIKNLKTLKNLEILYLSGNLISEIAGLRRLKQLRGLYLKNNKIKHLRGIKSLTSEIMYGGNPILVELDLGNNQISEITDLDSLHYLKKLNIEGNLITKIEGLEKLTNLSSLNLQLNPIREGEHEIADYTFPTPRVYDYKDGISQRPIESFENIVEYCQMKQIFIRRMLEFEFEIQREITLADLMEHFNMTPNEAAYYLDLLKTSVDYSLGEKKDLQLKIIERIKPSELKDINLLTLISDFEYNMKIAKKIGKFLEDEGYIDTFRRFPKKKDWNLEVTKRVEYLLNFNMDNYNRRKLLTYLPVLLNKEVSAEKLISFFKRTRERNYRHYFGDISWLVERFRLELKSLLFSQKFPSSRLSGDKWETFRDFLKTCRRSNTYDEAGYSWGGDYEGNLGDLLHILQNNRIFHEIGIQSKQKLKEIKSQSEKDSFTLLRNILRLTEEEYQINDQGYIIGLSLFNHQTDEGLPKKVLKLLKDFPHIRTLTTSDMWNTDLEFLQKNRDLENLTITYSFLPNLDSLASLQKLKTLRLNSNQFTQLNFPHLPQLLELNLTSNTILIEREEYNEYQRSNISLIEKVRGFDNLKHLQILNLANSNITKIEGLEALKNLRILNLSKNKITKIEGFDSIVQLEGLDLSHNLIKKIENLESLTHLRSLNLASNKIWDIGGLEALTQLFHLNLGRNFITKIEGLNKLSELRSLDLGHNGIYKMEGLSNLSKLEKLDLSLNQISEIEDVENLSNLKYLILISNHLQSTKGLENCPQIKDLVFIFHNNPIFLKERDRFRNVMPMRRKTQVQKCISCKKVISPPHYCIICEKSFCLDHCWSEKHNCLINKLKNEIS